MNLSRRLPPPMEPLAIRHYTATCAVGSGRAALAQAAQQSASGLSPSCSADGPIDTWIGRVPGLDALALPADLADWEGRATRLAWLGLQADGFADEVHAARARWGAQRVGLVLGTSASTIGVTERAYAHSAAGQPLGAELGHEALNTPHALAAFVQRCLALEGPCLTISTACSSSAKAFATAARWLALSLVDAVVVAGVDALCASLLYGFRSLGLVSSSPCRPFDVHRQGISLGEAACFALLELGPGSLQLLGYGESNDAHHMSAPHPQGVGAERALNDALARAGLSAQAVELASLHGTATLHNDAVEAALVARRYRADVHACATKGLTGHTMGAAGLLGAVFCLLALQGQGLPGTAHTTEPDPAFDGGFARQLRLQPASGRIRIAAQHAFGFGGNNCVLLLGGHPPESGAVA